jgi:Mn2+/Fe2+ NRAMP family transporter
VGRPHDAHSWLVPPEQLEGTLDFTAIDPTKALFWSAVINGVVAVPIMVMMMVLSVRATVMGQFTLPLPLHIMGWIATAVMSITAVAMLAVWLT